MILPIRTLLKLVFALLVSLLGYGANACEENCETISITEGDGQAIVRALAPLDGVNCYYIVSAKGTDTTIAVTGNNVIFSIENVVDAHTRYRLLTDREGYRVFVGQLLRSNTKQPYVLTITRQ